MERDQPPPFRWFLGWIGLVVGAVLGWILAEVLWNAMHPLGLTIHGGPHSRGVEYWLLKVSCSVAGAVLGLAITRWRDLPDGESTPLK